jgi:hypothetical protein
LAFERALAINSDDVQARYNLSFVHAARREYREALVYLAEGFALDRAGAFRQSLLKQQNEVLSLLDEQRIHQIQRQVDRLVPANKANEPTTGVNAPT